MPKLNLTMDYPWKKGLIFNDWANQLCVHCKGCQLECGKYMEVKFKDAQLNYQDHTKPKILVNDRMSAIDARLVSLLLAAPPKKTAENHKK